MVLLCHDQYSLLPDILEIFGDRAAEFLDSFGGQTITIPKADSIWEAGEDVRIFVHLHKAFRKDIAEIKEVIEKLSTATGKSSLTILAIYRKVRKIVEKHPHYRGLGDVTKKIEES